MTSKAGTSVDDIVGATNQVVDAKSETAANSASRIESMSRQPSLPFTVATSDSKESIFAAAQLDQKNPPATPPQTINAVAAKREPSVPKPQHRLYKSVMQHRMELLKLVADGGAGRTDSVTDTDGAWSYVTSAWLSGYKKEEQYIRIWKQYRPGQSTVHAAAKNVGILKAPLAAVWEVMRDNSLAMECSGGYTESIKKVEGRSMQLVTPGELSS